MRKEIIRKFLNAMLSQLSDGYWENVPERQLPDNNEELKDLLMEAIDLTPLEKINFIPKYFGMPELELGEFIQFACSITEEEIKQYQRGE